jgi:hypothetical protein
MLVFRIVVATVVAGLGGDRRNRHAGGGESEGAGADQGLHGFNSFCVFRFMRIFLNETATELSEIITCCFSVNFSSKCFLATARGGA